MRSASGLARRSRERQTMYQPGGHGGLGETTGCGAEALVSAITAP
jgi:hypothetical protein